MGKLSEFKLNVIIQLSLLNTYLQYSEELINDKLQSSINQINRGANYIWSIKQTDAMEKLFYAKIEFMIELIREMCGRTDRLSC